MYAISTLALELALSLTQSTVAKSHINAVKNDDSTE